MNKKFTVHISTPAGPRFSYHDSEEEMRQEFIEYWNEVHADGEDDMLDPDTELEEAQEKIQELEDVSVEEVWERFFADGTPDDGTRNPMLVSTEERDTILAALRYWQRYGRGSNTPEMDIALNGRETALSDEAIDELCERINR